jgi:hypothetical protein
LGRRLEVGKKSRGRERRAEIWEEEGIQNETRELSTDVIRKRKEWREKRTKGQNEEKTFIGFWRYCNLKMYH